ncbi:MAG: flavin-nucleotide-binding protein-like protein [Acidimicrobiales bacterium]|nr:flavin-nucleotide-binding protein-like protein [Acidimicrobiales bacterium]
MTAPLLTSLDWSGLEIVDVDECYRRLARSPVGRLGFVDRGDPVILPVNFAVDGRSLVFQSAAGSKLSSAVMNEPVCLEVDEWDVISHSGWSVLAKGMAGTVDDPTEVERLDSLPVRPWTRPDLRSQWVRILVEEVTGRSIHTAATAVTAHRAPGTRIATTTSST